MAPIMAATTGNGLPPGWILRVSKSKGKVFYYNTLTKETQWSRPIAPAVVPTTVSEASDNSVSSTDIHANKRKRSHDDEVGGHADSIARCIRVGASDAKSKTPFVPWPHQVDAVAKLLEALKLDPPGANRYLFQHSTGSGKTITIAAMTHQLLYFRDTHDQRFHTIVLLIDRIKLDEQVGDTVATFLRRNGVECVYRATSIEHLASLLTTGSPQDQESNPQRVIITTIQKLGLLAKNPVLLTRLFHRDASESCMNYSRTAIITDEAHRSHTSSTRQTIEMIMRKSDEEHTSSGNITFVGFTATPNAESLDLFGKASTTGSSVTVEPFHCYSMAQAVADRRIMDVLRDFESVRCELEVSIPEHVKGELKRARLMRQIMDCASDDGDVLKAKAAYMMADFEKVKATWKSAKCMVVTRSRKDVVRYFELLRAYLRNKQLPWKAFAVFSGSVALDGIDESRTSKLVTEQSLNANDSTLASSDIVVVCDKLDTGYSDPLLAAMYVDRYLRSSVQTVQLFSRLNRKHRDKSSVRIVDFSNNPTQIRRHFAKFWLKATTRRERTLPAIADVRTAIAVVWDIASPPSIEWELSTQQSRDRMEELITSLDRDAFQQVWDALRFGLSARDECSNDELGVFPQHWLRSMDTLKTLIGNATLPIEDVSIDVQAIVTKMKARVTKNQQAYSGSIDPITLLRAAAPKSIDSLGDSRDSLQIFDVLVGSFETARRLSDAQLCDFTRRFEASHHSGTRTRWSTLILQLVQWMKELSGKH